MTTQQKHSRINGASFTDQRRTTCKICTFSLLIGEPAVWLTSPMGLSHKACAAALARA